MQVRWRWFHQSRARPPNMANNVQHIRLRRPDPVPQPKQPPRHTGILQDQLRRAARRPWNPSFSLAVRILLLMRFAAAMYSNIDDCDEGAPAAPYSSVLMRNSLQLLGAAPFFRPRTRVSDMGSLSPIRHSELDVHTPPHRSCKTLEAAVDR